MGMLPIIKNKPFSVALTSYYGKVFVLRNQNNATNFTKWIQKNLLSRANDPENNSVTELVYGINIFKNIILPRHYTAIGSAITAFKSLRYNFYWNYNNLDRFFSKSEQRSLKDKDLIPCGRTNKGLLGMDSTNTISLLSNNKLELLGSITSLIGDGLGNGPIEYSEVSVYNKRLPLVIVLGFHMGFDNLLKSLNIPFSTMPIGARIGNLENVFLLKFKDITYVINISNPEHRLIIGGFNAFRKVISNFKANDLNKQHVYASLVSKIGITQVHLRELKLMFNMFVDPITLGLLEEMGEPTNFKALLLRANELLINDYTPQTTQARFKGYERLAGMVYHQLINSIRGYKSRGSLPNAEVVMNPTSVWLDILQDQTIAIVEELNPIQNLKEKEAVTFSGAGGRSTQSMVKSTRGFSNSDIGTISESSPDSAKVGIRTYMSPDPNLINLRGITRPFDKTKDGATKILSTSALLSPAINHDDKINYCRLN